MQVCDIMTRSVLSVAPDTSVRHIAQLLVDHGISAVPVVAEGHPIGIVSETDLVRRASSARTREAGWLAALLRGPAAAGSLDDMFRSDLTARDVMTSPVIAVSADASLDEVLHIMVARSVKRLPVLSAGRICGIVSRPDVLRAVSKANVRHNSHAPVEAETGDAPDSPAAGEVGEEVISASAFRDAAETFKAHLAETLVQERRHNKEEHDREIAQFLEQSLTTDVWRAMLLRARSAAEHGATDVEILRFPCGVCSDAGRAINNADPHWLETLRGLPAEVAARTHDELRPKGFRLQAQIVDFPNGVPGHAGLFLSWSKF